MSINNKQIFEKTKATFQSVTFQNITTWNKEKQSNIEKSQRKEKNHDIINYTI